MSKGVIPVVLLVVVAVGVALWALWKYRSEVARRLHLERYIDNLMPYTEAEAPSIVLPDVPAPEPGRIEPIEEEEEESEVSEEPAEPAPPEPAAAPEPAEPVLPAPIYRTEPPAAHIIRADVPRIEEIEEDLPAPAPVVDDDAALIAAAEAAAATPRRSRRGQRA